MKKKVMMISCIAFLFTILTGCQEKEHTTFNTPELYYLPEQAMKQAGKTTQITTIYIANEDKDYGSIESMLKEVSPQDSKTVLTCDFKNNTCEEYFLLDNTSSGNVTYTYRLDANNDYIISKIGNGSYNEYIFEDGKINGINEYVGSEKTADSTPITTRVFNYASNGTCISNVVEATDNSGNPIQYRYNFQYDEETGALIRINTIGTDANGTEIVSGYIDFTYNEEGLMSSSTYYGVVATEKRIVSHQIYEYE